jgi:alpha-mannosidase
MEVLGVVSTNLFVGSEDDPRQVVRLRLGGEPASGRSSPPTDVASVRIEGGRVRTPAAVSIGPLGPGEEASLEIGVIVDGPTALGQTLPAEIVIDGGGRPARHPFDLVVAEPGWQMFMIAHFHYDPVWWNTQAAYTETWGAAIQYRSPFQEPGLALVRAHLEMARRDPDYKFVLAELDYLKPYWDVFPEDREYIRRLMADGRLELMGGTYNEPNTNLTSAESTIRNALYGIGYQRDVLGGTPATAWQLDAFGHDPQFPGIMADAGVSSSSWARGPFHEWGPHWVRGPGRLPIAELAVGDVPKMQFANEFDWVSPSGRALLTSFMADHYSAGWWMDSSITLEEAEAAVHSIFTELAETAATRNVLLPVGTDYSPPNKWMTAIQRDWNRRYVWPRFISALPREFFAAVRAERANARPFTPQTRDMNPVYTGKDVSFIDTKQAQRTAENTLLSAEKFATIAYVLGAQFPTETIDKAWRQLLFGAHHDGITGSESDQVYLDLLGGWRESLELGTAALESAIDYLGGKIDTSGEGRALSVFNPLSWSRTDIARVDIDVPSGSEGVGLEDDAGNAVPFVVEATDRGDDGRLLRVSLAFLARDVPAMGYRTYRVLPGGTSPDELGWNERAADGYTIDNEAYSLTADPDRGGAITRLVATATGKEVLQTGRFANELLAYREYPNHPLFAEGPWHLTPDGRLASSVDRPVEIRVEECPIGRRIAIDGPFEACRRHQEITLWDGLDRVEFRTRIDDYDGHDRLFRVRFSAAVEGGRPLSETGNATIARGFGFPNVDVAEVPFTLDNPAFNWFGLGTSARVSLVEPGSNEKPPASEVAIGIAEVVASGDAALDQAVRALVIALVRQGVTSTVSSHDRDRYGILHIDSNLPDARIAIGQPSENDFVAAVLEAAPDYRAEFDRQLNTQGWARLWVPAMPDKGARSGPFPDLRDARALPVLLIAASDTSATRHAVDALAADLADGAVTVVQPHALHPSGARTENATVAILNRGLPGFNVEPDGSLYLSLMRSCSGWPSGVWIDPPRRAAPDGSNFQFQHWTHNFEYALTARAGDWREGQIVQEGHEYNNPLLTRILEPQSGTLPATNAFVEVDPPSAVLTALKPAGNPSTRLAARDPGAADRLVARVYESSGRSARARLASALRIVGAETTNVMEEASATPLERTAVAVELPLEPFEIATVRLTTDARRVADVRPSTNDSLHLAHRGEPAQPVFSDYWMHNKGAAPLGYQPVTVQIRPRVIEGSGPIRMPIVVASGRTDADTSGKVSLIVPPGWRASPPERPYTLAPGSHFGFDAVVTPADGVVPGRYFVAARIADDAGQLHEDVVTIEVPAATDRRSRRDGHDGTATEGEASGSSVGSASLAMSVERALRTAGLNDADPSAGIVPAAEPGDELEIELLTTSVEVAPGAADQLEVALRNTAASEIRGEAQLISPHETWATITPWTQGFTVGAGETTVLTFTVAPPFGQSDGTYWALVKVMYFGRLHYTTTARVAIHATATSGSRMALASHSAG